MLEQRCVLFYLTRLKSLPSALQSSVLYSAVILRAKMGKRILSQPQKQYTGSHKLRENESPLDSRALKVLGLLLLAPFPLKVCLIIVSWVLNPLFGIFYLFS